MTSQPEITIEQLRRGLSDYVRRAAYGRERFLVTFHGRAIAALGPLDESESPRKEAAKKAAPKPASRQKRK